MADITINQVNLNIGKAEKCFTGANKKKIQFPLLKLAEGLEKYRIFNEGKSSDGSAIGKYKSARYAAYRTSRGRQTAYKDLQVEGDLLRALTVGTNGNDFVLGFATDKARLIGAAQETQTGKKIWQPTDSEIKDIQKQAIKEFRKCFKKSFK